MIIRTQIAEYLDQPPVALFQDSDFYDRTVELILALGGGGGGTVTSVAATGGTGISITGSPVTTSGTFTITNTAPDQTVVLTNGTGISVTGTYPNFTITNTSPSTVVPAALSKVDDTNVTMTLSGTPSIALLQATTITLGWTGTLADARIASATTWNNKLNNGTNTGASQVTLGSATATANAIISIKNASGPIGALISGNGSTNAVGLGSVGSGAYLQGYTSVGSGTSNLIIQPSGSNVLVATSTDGGEKFQVNGSMALDLGSDATGDILYRNSGGSLARLPIGSTNDVLTVSSGLPSWAASSGGGTVTSVASANSDATISTPSPNPVITINSAPKWSTARNLAGNSVDGSGDVAFANKFIVQGTTDTGLSSAQFLGALGTGILKNTTTTGVLSIASAGTDYVAPSTTVNGYALSSNVTVNLSDLGDTNIVSPVNHSILEYLTADNKWHVGTATNGTVTTLSVATANGFAGTVANATTTPAITLTTSVTGILKGNGTAISAATPGTDYLTSNQTITLSGAVTGSGATSITTTLANSIVGIANLTATGTPSNTTYLRGDNTWATLPSGAGTVTSVGLSLPTEITVSNSPVTTTGTLTGVWANQTTNKFFAAPNGSTGTPTFRVIATADLGTGSASSSNYLRGDLTWATVSASPAGSTTQVQYNNAGTTDGAANVTIDLTDENLTLLSTNTTSAIAAPSAGLKIWGDNRAGLDQPHFTPTVGVDYWLQPSLGQKVVSQYSFGTSVSGIGNYASSSSAGTTAEVVKTYDATNLLPNYSYRRITTNATTNVSAEFFVNTTGRGPTMGNNVYGGGFKFMVTFGFPTYLSTERIFVGVTSVAAQNATTTDPSAWLNMLGVAKDAADTTLQFMTNAGTGTATKTNTGITPNANDVYRMTLFVPSNSASAYIMLERFTKSAVTIADTSFTGSKLMGGLIVYTHVMVNTAAVASAIQLAIMNQQLEEF